MNVTVNGKVYRCDDERDVMLVFAMWQMRLHMAYASASL